MPAAGARLRRPGGHRRPLHRRRVLSAGPHTAQVGAAARADAVAIVGMAAVLPGAPDLEAAWQQLVARAEPVADAVAHAAVDAVRLGLPTGELAARDPEELLAAQVAADAIDDAGGPARLPASARVGLVAGRGAGPAAVHPPGSSPSALGARVAALLGAGGPALTVATGGAAALVAVDLAVRELRDDRCDAVLAGGVDHGAGMVLLKRLEDARRDGDRIYAVVRGTGVAGDGAARDGRLRAIRMAWAAAGIDPVADDALGLLEAHGAGTPEEDRAELDALAEAFGDRDAGPSAAFAWPGPRDGAARPAAGFAGFLTAALALHRAVRVPAPRPGPAGLERTRFAPLAAAEPWEDPDGDDGVRRAGVSAFGRDGVHAHVVLEADADPAPRPASRAHATPAEPAEPVLLLGAADVAGLAVLLEADDAALIAQAGDGVRPATGEGPRLAIVAPDAKRLKLARRVVGKALAAPDAPKAWRGRSDVWFSPAPLLAPGPDAGKVAFLFAGLDADFDPRVADVAVQFGLPLPSVSAATLGEHGRGVLAVGALLDSALRAIGVRPDVVAGNSVGEWSAMFAAGMVTPARMEAHLVELLAEGNPFPQLDFGVLGCGPEPVRAALAGRDGIVISHENSPRQTLVCGPPAAVDALLSAFRADGVIGQVLPFRSGFHTPMFDAYSQPLRRLARWLALRPAHTPIYSATTVGPYPATADGVRDVFIRHMLEPVRFGALLERLHDDGVRAFVQVGAGQLGSLVDDTLGERPHVVVPTVSPHRDGLAQLRRVASALWVEGAEPDFAALMPGAPARSRAASRGRRVPVDLAPVATAVSGAGPVALPAPAPSAAPVAPRAPAPSASPAAAPVPAHARLAAVGATPWVGELRALLEETDAAVDAVLAAAAAPRPTARAPALRLPPPAAAPLPVRSTLSVSLGEMPFLVDHSFAVQRPGWPEEADRRPVVPATTLIALITRAAGDALPGLRATAITGLRLKRWLLASPAVEVPVTATPLGPDRVRVVVGDYCEAVVELGPDHLPAPPARPVPALGEGPTTLTAEALYESRCMFHGPSFRGIVEITGVSPLSTSAKLRALPPTGALLDTAGQLIGAWVEQTQTERELLFPVGIERLEFHTPEPPPGSDCACAVEITAVDDVDVIADGEISCDGKVWVSFTGWASRRFYGDAAYRPGYRFPERNLLGERRPEGWMLVEHRWSDIASRDLYMMKYLGAPERAAYEEIGPNRRRSWVLGRFAAKDAVRDLLWRNGAGTVFPAEVEITNDAAGRPIATGRHGLELPPLQLSIAHSGELAVAAVRPTEHGDGGIGIDIEEITERDASVIEIACSPEEQAVLAGLIAETGESAALWFTRFWAAKEAVAKAKGTGLEGRPQRFRVLGGTRDELRLEVPSRTSAGHAAGYAVPLATVDNPPALPPRQYVVAWTGLGEPAQPEGQDNG